MPNFSRTELKTKLSPKISGTISDGDLNTILNDAVIETLADIDMRSMKRKSALSPNLFDDIFDYTAPTDLKSNKIIDIKPQIHRGRMDEWRLTTEEEFDRLKEDHRVDEWGDPIKISRSQWLGDSLVAISDADFVRKIKLSRPIDDDSVTISDLDAVGTWVLFGDGENLTADSSNYVKGSGSINWDISSAGGTTAGIQNSSISSFSIADYLSEGSFFVWVYITSATNLTNFILRVGSSSSAYYYITITTANEGAAFRSGWNLLRFDLINKETNSSPVSTACTHVALYMTKAAGKVSETDYRFDWLVLKKGNHYDLIYYSKYGWQDDTGTYLEESTDDTDLLNVDTDELRIVLQKAVELGEIHLRSGRDGDALTRYTNYKTDYEFKNPSEALLLTTTYYHI